MLGIKGCNTFLVSHFAKLCSYQFLSYIFQALSSLEETAMLAVRLNSFREQCQLELFGYPDSVTRVSFLTNDLRIRILCLSIFKFRLCLSTNRKVLILTIIPITIRIISVTC